MPDIVFRLSAIRDECGGRAVAPEWEGDCVACVAVRLTDLEIET